MGFNGLFFKLYTEGSRKIIIMLLYNSTWIYFDPNLEQFHHYMRWKKLNILIFELLWIAVQFLPNTTYIWGKYLCYWQWLIQGLIADKVAYGHICRVVKRDLFTHWQRWNKCKIRKMRNWNGLIPFFLCFLFYLMYDYIPWSIFQNAFRYKILDFKI